MKLACPAHPFCRWGDRQEKSRGPRPQSESWFHQALTLEPSVTAKGLMEDTSQGEQGAGLEADCRPRSLRGLNARMEAQAPKDGS
jgi:hypothetical protein